MNYKSFSIKQTRENLAELVEKAALTKSSFIITKFGKPKAAIVPLSEDMLPKNQKKLRTQAKGLWKDRTDMKNSADWVSNLRQKQNQRSQ